MTEERLKFLNETPDMSVSLTEQELDEGWHWCPELDGLLMGPGTCEVCGNKPKDP